MIPLNMFFEPGDLSRNCNVSQNSLAAEPLKLIIGKILIEIMWSGKN